MYYSQLLNLLYRPTLSKASWISGRYFWQADTSGRPKTNKLCQGTIWWYVHSSGSAKCITAGREIIILQLSFFYRAMLCIRGTSHGPVSVCLCPSVCLCQSVTSRCSIKTAKHRITQTTPHCGVVCVSRDSSFLVPKISAKLDRGHPLQGRRMQVGWVKIGDFRQITGYISKTVQDRHILSIKVE